MCGSSLDAVDVAWLQGNQLFHFSAHPLPRGLTQLLRPCLEGEPLTAAEMARLDVTAAQSFVDAVRRSGCGLTPDLVACHGVTVGHDPAAGYSWQLGNLAVLSRGLGATVVGHFRDQDVAGGGEGAPLAPLFHRLMFGTANESRVVVNLGGIANLSELPAQGPLRGYDIGPCNLLTDALYRQLYQDAGNYDVDGKRAVTGRAHEEVLSPFLAHPFLQLAPPKSTGRETFGRSFVTAFAAACEQGRMDAEDILRTACRYIAANLAEHLRHASNAGGGWQRLLLCGGGSHNTALVAEIREAVAPLPVEKTTNHGIDPDAVEAAGFALLGLETITGHGQSLKAVTGGPDCPILGQVQPGPGYHDLLARVSRHGA